MSPCIHGTVYFTARGWECTSCQELFMPKRDLDAARKQHDALRKAMEEAVLDLAQMKGVDIAAVKARIDEALKQHYMTR